MLQSSERAQSDLLSKSSSCVVFLQISRWACLFLGDPQKWWFSCSLPLKPTKKAYPQERQRPTSRRRPMRLQRKSQSVGEDHGIFMKILRPLHGLEHLLTSPQENWWPKVEMPKQHLAMLYCYVSTHHRYTHTQPYRKNRDRTARASTK